MRLKTFEQISNGGGYSPEELFAVLSGKLEKIFTSREEADGYCRNMNDDFEKKYPNYFTGSSLPKKYIYKVVTLKEVMDKISSDVHDDYEAEEWRDKPNSNLP